MAMLNNKRVPTKTTSHCVETLVCFLCNTNGPGMIVIQKFPSLTGDHQIALYFDLFFHSPCHSQSLLKAHWIRVLRTVSSEGLLVSWCLMGNINGIFGTLMAPKRLILTTGIAGSWQMWTSVWCIENHVDEQITNKVSTGLVKRCGHTSPIHNNEIITVITLNNPWNGNSHYVIDPNKAKTNNQFTHPTVNSHSYGNHGPFSSMIDLTYYTW